MLASFVSWWLARVTELLPRALTIAAARPRDGIVVQSNPDGFVTVWLRRRGRSTRSSLGAAARLAVRKVVVLHPPAVSVLVKSHVVPTVPPRQLGQMLHHELARITPFAAEDLFWRWDARTRPTNRSRTDVVLAMVPRKTLEPALAALDEVGLKADFVEVSAAGRLWLLPINSAANRTTGTILTRGLAWGCAGLAVIALLMPLGLQAVALQQTDTAIAELQPTIAQIDALRRGMAAGEAGRDILAQETNRTADILQTLAAVTRILPDDTYLTDFSLHERQMTLSGRSASAPRLITGLSSDPAIRNAAFAAPVTRTEGAAADLFSIRAEVTK
jgi:general secretion pathway protein L